MVDFSFFPSDVDTSGSNEVLLIINISCHNSQYPMAVSGRLVNQCPDMVFFFVFLTAKRHETGHFERVETLWHVQI